MQSESEIYAMMDDWYERQFDEANYNAEKEDAELYEEEMDSRFCEEYGK